MLYVGSDGSGTELLVSKHSKSRVSLPILYL